MSYLVLARKWRPQSFDEIVGQEAVTTILFNAIKQDRIAHAFLFAGMRGVGKTTTARVLARCLNCAEGISANPCGKCDACLETTAGSALDVMEIDGASNRGINEIRELRENARYSPSRDRYKIFIIDEVHMLTQEAFNALLKTLEEPPPHVIFILATTELQKIPVTIVSRCQLFEFKRVPHGAMAEYLERICREESVSITSRSLQLITRASGGSMRDALSTLDQVISFCGTDVTDDQVLHLLDVTEFELLQDAATLILDGDSAGAFMLVGRLREKGHDLSRFCRDLLGHMRNLMLVKLFGTDDRIQDGALAALSDEELSALAEIAGRYTEPNLLWCVDLLLKAEQEMKWASQPDFLLEAVLVKLAQQEKLVALDTILERLDPGALEVEGTATGPGKKAKPDRPPAARTGPEERPKRGSGEQRQEKKGHGKPKTRESVEPVDSAGLPEPSGAPDPEPPPDLVDAAAAAADSGPPAADPVPEPISPDAETSPEEPPTTELGKFLRRVKSKKPSLHAMLVLAGGIRIGKEKIDIVFAEDDTFYKDNVSKKENLAELETLAGTYFGRELAVRVRQGDVKEMEGLEEPPAPPKPARKRDRLKEEALEDPTVRKVLDLFGGQILDIEEP